MPPCPPCLRAAGCTKPLTRRTGAPSATRRERTTSTRRGSGGSPVRASLFAGGEAREATSPRGRGRRGRPSWPDPTRVGTSASGSSAARIAPARQAAIAAAKHSQPVAHHHRPTPPEKATGEGAGPTQETTPPAWRLGATGVCAHGTERGHPALAMLRRRCGPLSGAFAVRPRRGRPWLVAVGAGAGFSPRQTHGPSAKPFVPDSGRMCARPATAAASPVPGRSLAVPANPGGPGGRFYLAIGSA